MNNALKEILNEYDIKSIVADNRLEFVMFHEVFDKEKIYYSDRYFSYEIGNNENHNRIIRKFLPKGTKKY